MTIAQLMIKHHVERVAYVPASDLLPRYEFHAWLFGETMECGIGATPEEAIDDAVAKLTRKAA
jgi:hypothetical protein